MPHRIRHAQAYPFPSPDRSFVYDHGETRDLDHARLPREGRVPVLAAGSNQSPEQLHRKFETHDGDRLIPAQRGRLHDFDVVYAAHLTGYGSVPATFQGAPGVAVTVFVLWLDEAQLARMHATEGNYTYDHLTGIHIELDDGQDALSDAYAYSSKFGCLNHESACVGIAEIPATGRQLPEATQPEILGRVRDRLAPGRALDDFILDHLEDRDVHRQRSRALGVDALPLTYPRRTLVTL